MRYYILIIVTILTNSCNSQHGITAEQRAQINKIKENFVFVEGGTFEMGKDGMPESNPRHNVILDSYSLSKYETTFKDFDTYTAINDLDFIKKKYRDQRAMGQNYGICFISWYQARDYCKWLGKQLNLSLDLPTEAQWEYAARSRGLDVQHATDSGNIEGSYTEKRNYNGSKVEVGSYPPNPLGVYDMSGGRPEWVRDWFFSYDEEPRTNPVQDSIRYSKSKIVRGWHTLSNSVYGRGKRKPDFDKDIVGFRCVCNQKTPIE